MGDTSDSNSDDELMNLLESSSKNWSYFSNFDTNNLVNEYSKYGVFNSKEFQEPGFDLTECSLYKEFLSTLKSLSDTYTFHEYVRYLFVKDRSQVSKNFNFVVSDSFDDNMKHYELFVHVNPHHLIGKCTLREVDGAVGMVNNDNLIVKTVNYALTTPDVLNVLKSLGFKVSKKHKVVSQVFHMNYGSKNYVQVSVQRHCDPEKKLSPSSMLVEIKCFGSSDLEFYKNTINTVSKLLYRFVKF